MNCYTTINKSYIIYTFLGILVLIACFSFAFGELGFASVLASPGVALANAGFSFIV
jgi:hypothetical protein